MTSDTLIARAAAGGPRARVAESARREGAERLAQLTERLEAVAVELSSPSKSQSERTVLRAQFHELQRQVNRLDGIVSGEGMEAGGQGRVARGEAGNQAATSPADAAPAREAAAEPAAAPGTTRSPSSGASQVDVIA